MQTRFHFTIQAQPDGVTCGPTCLQGIYDFWNDPVDLEQVIDEVHLFEEGGTLAVLLAHHALRRGYRATIVPYNLRWLDPTWFGLPMDGIADKLRQQIDRIDHAKSHGRAERAADAKRRLTCQAYVDFLELGGRLRFADLSRDLVIEPLQRGVPVLTGLSATWLYRSPREDPRTEEDDDVAGSPSGHFVVLCGYDAARDEIAVADPYRENPIRRQNHYEVRVDRLLTSVLLGIVTYDANLLVIEPGDHVRSEDS